MNDTNSFGDTEYISNTPFLDKRMNLGHLAFIHEFRYKKNAFIIILVFNSVVSCLGLIDGNRYLMTIYVLRMSIHVNSIIIYAIYIRIRDFGQLSETGHQQLLLIKNARTCFAIVCFFYYGRLFLRCNAFGQILSKTKRAFLQKW